jgi:transposase-like protein
MFAILARRAVSVVTRSTSTVLNSTCRFKSGATRPPPNRFLKRVLRASPLPRKMVTDQLRSHSAAKAETPELVSMKHGFVKAAARLNQIV